MSRARLMPNGTLHYPMRGNPPRIIQGYKRSKSNPYVLEPILQSCSHRKIDITYLENCKCERARIMCDILGTTNMSHCWDCPHASSITPKTCAACHEITFEGKEASSLYLRDS